MSEEKKYYKIGAKEYYLNKLTFNQMKAITKLTAGIITPESFKKSESAVMSLAVSIMDSAVFEEVLFTILIEKGKKYDKSKKASKGFIDVVGDMDGEIVMEIVKNFLSLDTVLLNSLKDILSTNFQTLTKKEIKDKAFTKTTAAAANSAKNILDGSSTLE